ncbi:hypothetical protein ACO0RG_004530 [Hanseniaspora osmophila]|uniref:Vacuolar protein-sorting-associated protein 46 n=1 Tax=Hanseniaspora osmophila TaxID=56408 RepID=A0A1E5RZ90_9ASCO|nr:Vacuolar protein-sorting-associated protein 46 [Hanseniaspora osmophila]
MSSRANSLENTLFQLKFTSKQLLKQAQKSLKEAKVNEKKLTKLLSQADSSDNAEIVKIYASNVVRKKNEHLQLLKLQSKIDGIISRLNTSLIMKNLNSNFYKITKNLDVALRTMNLEQITMIMEKFESQFEEIDTNVESFNSLTNSNVMMKQQDNDEVDNLISKLRDENGLKLPDVNNTEEVPISIDEPTTNKEDELEDKLAQRLKALRG